MFKVTNIMFKFNMSFTVTENRVEIREVHGEKHFVSKKTFSSSSQVYYCMNRSRSKRTH